MVRLISFFFEKDAVIAEDNKNLFEVGGLYTSSLIKWNNQNNSKNNEIGYQFQATGFGIFSDIVFFKNRWFSPLFGLKYYKESYTMTITESSNLPLVATLDGFWYGAFTGSRMHFTENIFLDSCALIDFGRRIEFRGILRNTTTSTFIPFFGHAEGALKYGVTFNLGLHLLKSLVLVYQLEISKARLKGLRIFGNTLSQSQKDLYSSQVDSYSYYVLGRVGFLLSF